MDQHPHDTLLQAMNASISPDRRPAWPSDYYSSPAPAPIVSRNVKYGCGVASALFLILLFAGGTFLASGGLVDFIDLSVGMAVGDMRSQYSNVSPSDQKSLESEIETMRTNLRGKKIAVQSVQPFLEQLRESVSDGKVTAGEARKLRETAAKINRR
jgi:hypothetical protein